MKAMIFAAGLGTRLKPITDTIPKALLPIGGKTLLEWQLEKLRHAGIQDVVINVHHFADMIEDFVREHDSFGMNIRFSSERDMLLETGGGLRKATNLLTANSLAANYLAAGSLENALSSADCKQPSDEPILVMNVDVLSNIDLKAVIAAHQPSHLSTIVVSERKTQRYFVFDQNYVLRGWTNIATGECKPASLSEQLNPGQDSSQSESQGFHLLAFSGMHIVSPRIFSLMQSWPEKFSIVDFYLKALETETIDAYIPSNYRMMDIGKIDHLDEAQTFAESLLKLET